MRVACRRPHHLTYRHTAYTIIIFYILHRVTCNSTTTNTASITSSNTASTTFVTSVFSTPNPNKSTVSHAFATSQTSTIGNMTNVTSGLSTATTVHSTFNTSYNNASSTITITESVSTDNATTISSFTTVTPNATSYNTTITASYNVSTNSTVFTMSMPLVTNCSVATNAYNLTNSSNACHTKTEIIRFKETNATGIEGGNVTIKGNYTWNCSSVSWVRHYNLSTHGYHLGYRQNVYTQYYYRWLRILTSHTICHSPHQNPTSYHDLCRSCNNTELYLYDLNTTNSGRYSRRCFKEDHLKGHHEDENFYLFVTPRNETNHTEIINITFVCPRTNTNTKNKNEEQSQHTNSTHHHKHNPHHSSQRSRTVWTIMLICVACLLLFFGRRAFNKKYQMLHDTVSESEFIVRYNPEHED
ncbi:membrane protein RL12 [Human betaherpesvirus 5]|nr:membrane protein RL12 [Human betaherpesvirus 5]